jgi:general L-amino acid transport system permease protein
MRRVNTNLARVAWQALLVGVVLAAIALLAANVSGNMQSRGLGGGYGFLTQPAGFDIAETFPLPWKGAEGWGFTSYAPEGSYRLAFATGVINTLKVGVVGVVLATLLGVFVSVFASVPGSPLALVAQAYIRTSRNVPLLLQLLLWYVILLAVLPDVESSLRVGDVFLNNRGLFVPGPVVSEGGSLAWDVPELVFGGRNLRGGLALSPEFVALTAGLSLYTASFIAELLRAAITTLPRGQGEAAAALGLSRAQAFRTVVFPQALRVAVPPLVSQYLNLLKNSSLAVAIGYPEVVGVGGTIINQTGQALEVVALWMAVFLSFSLLASAVLNGWNRRLRVREGAAT